MDNCLRLHRLSGRPSGGMGPLQVLVNLAWMSSIAANLYGLQMSAPGLF